MQHACWQSLPFQRQGRRARTRSGVGLRPGSRARTSCRPQDELETSGCTPDPRRHSARADYVLHRLLVLRLDDGSAMIDSGSWLSLSGSEAQHAMRDGQGRG